MDNILKGLYSFSLSLCGGGSSTDLWCEEIKAHGMTKSIGQKVEI
jgi:hypothetical protein